MSGRKRGQVKIRGCGGQKENNEEVCKITWEKGGKKNYVLSGNKAQPKASIAAGIWTGVYDVMQQKLAGRCREVNKDINI